MKNELEAFNWRNTKPLLKEDNLRKGSKYNELDYRLQFIKAYQFIKINEQEETLTKIFIDEIYAKAPSKKIMKLIKLFTKE